MSNHQTSATFAETKIAQMVSYGYDASEFTITAEGNVVHTTQGVTYLDDSKSGVFCKGCDQELDGEGLHELYENEGYTGCCNKSTY